MQEKPSAGESTWVDPDGAPELDAEYFEAADVFDGATSVRRGRPKLEAPEKMLSMRLEPEVIDALRATGPGWQRRANDILKSALKIG
jgi:uncharacterized protein (DUF4415 family)